MKFHLREAHLHVPFKKGMVGSKAVLQKILGVVQNGWMARIVAAHRIFPDTKS